MINVKTSSGGRYLVSFGDVDQNFGPLYGARCVTTCEVWAKDVDQCMYCVGHGRSILHPHDYYNPRIARHKALESALPYWLSRQEKRELHQAVDGW